MTQTAIFLICLILASGTWVIGSKSSEKIALKSQLDICAISIYQNKLSVLKKLQTSNKTIETLRLSIYLARGIKFVPGIGAISALSFGAIAESAAMSALKSIVAVQESIISANSLFEQKNRICAKTPFSNKIAFCNFSSLNRALFHRRISLFPDIPGPLELKNIQNEQATCFQVNNLTTIIFKTSPNLTLSSYEYKK